MTQIKRMEGTDKLTFSELEKLACPWRMALKVQLSLTLYSGTVLRAKGPPRVDSVI
jgi:hypothetical protein